MDVSALAVEIQTQDLGRRINALLQLLHETCIGQEVGPLIALVCNKVVAEANPVPVKKLGYELVRAATLSVNDWEAVATGLKADINDRKYDETQIAALQTVPAVPSWKLPSLLQPPVSLGDDIVTCLSSTSKTVRRMAVEALSHLLVSAAVLQTVVEHQVLRNSVLSWAEFVGDHLLDQSDTVVIVTHSCIARILATTFPEGSEDQPRRELHARIKGLLCTRILKALAVVLERTASFPPAAAIEVCRLVTATTTTLLCASSSQDLAFAMEEYGWKGRGYYHEAVVTEAAAYLGKFVGDVECDPALALAACKSMLELSGVVSREVGNMGWSIHKQWAPLAVKTLVKLTAHNAHLDTRVDLARLTAEHLSVLSAADQYVAIRAMLPVVLGIFSEWDRCTFMSNMWTVVADADIRNRVRQIRGSKGSAAVDMNKVLEDGLVRELVTGVVSGGAEGSSRFATLPQFREELVATLAAVVLHHPDAQVARLQGLFPLEGPPMGNVEDMMDVLFGALAWLGLARVVLLGTKSCMGWEREGAVEEVATVTSAPVDLWLQLLQHALYVAGEVRRAGGQVTFVTDDADDPFRKDTEDAEPSLEDRFSEMVNNYADAYQLLLRQIVLNWKVLSPGIKPRALLVGAQHLLLLPQQDDSWTGLLDATRQALFSRPPGGATPLAAAKAADLGQLAYTGKDAQQEVDALRFQAANEGVEVALLTLEHLAALLQRFRPPPPPGNAPLSEGDLLPKGYKDLVNALVDIPRDAIKDPAMDAASRQRCQRIVAQLAPLGALQVNPAAPEVPPEQLDTLKPINAKWASRSPGGYPLGPAIGTALFRARREVRYRKLDAVVHETVQAARRIRPRFESVQAEEPTILDVLFAEPPPPEVDTCDFLQDMLAGAGAAAVGGRELTGCGDPVQLTAWHEVGANGQVLTVHLTLRNRLAAPLQDVAVRLWLTGSLSAHVRGPLVHRPTHIEPGERVQWSVELTMTGFGRVVLQPSIGFGAKARQGVGLRCRAYEIPATQLLLPASKDVYGSDVLFQYWAGLPFGATMDAVSSIPGPEAGLYVMSALQAHSHTTMVLGNTVPVSGGFKAAAMGLTQEGDTVGIVINGALASGQEGAEGRVVCSVHVRSTSAAVATAFREGAAAWLADISGGLLRPAGEITGGNVVSNAEFVPLLDTRAAADPMFATVSADGGLAGALQSLSLDDEGGRPRGPSGALPTPLEQWKALKKAAAARA